MPDETHRQGRAAGRPRSPASAPRVAATAGRHRHHRRPRRDLLRIRRIRRLPPAGYPPQPPGRVPGPFSRWPLRRLRPAAATPSAVPYAGWGTRLGGYLIDCVIFIPVLVVLYVVLRHTHTLDGASHDAAQRHPRAAHRLAAGAPHHGAGSSSSTPPSCTAARGQTVGMMAVGVRVVRDEAHDALGYGRALWRASVEQFLRLLATVTLILGIIWLLDMLFPLWDKKRQTLHDKLAKTVVLRVRPTG